VSPEQKWAEALASVFAGRKPAEVAPIVGVSIETIRRWLRGERIPCGWMWLALVEQAGKGEQWPALSAARDAVARSAGRPRKPDAELKEAAERRALARRKEVRRGKAD